MSYDEFLDRFPHYKKDDELGKIIFHETQIVVWASCLKNHELNPCLSGLTYKQLSANMYDKIMRINKYFYKLCIIDHKKKDILQDFKNE